MLIECACVGNCLQTHVCHRYKNALTVFQVLWTGKAIVVVKNSLAFEPSSLGKDEYCLLYIKDVMSTLIIVYSVGYCLALCGVINFYRGYPISVILHK